MSINVIFGLFWSCRILDSSGEKLGLMNGSKSMRLMGYSLRYRVQVCVCVYCWSAPVIRARGFICCGSECEVWQPGLMNSDARQLLINRKPVSQQTGTANTHSMQTTHTQSVCNPFISLTCGISWGGSRLLDSELTLEWDGLSPSAFILSDWHLLTSV